MLVKNKQFGWKFFFAVVTLAIIALAMIDPRLERNPFVTLKHSFSNFVIVSLGLTGAKPDSYITLFKKITSKTIQGDFPKAQDQLNLHIRFKHLRSIRAERAKAQELGILAGSKFYPAKLEHDGTTYAIRIRLKGDLADHWNGANRWSFRVQIRGGRTVMGMSQFSIHKPLSRQLPYDHLFQSWLRKAGNLTPRHKYARVRFNGDDWGLMNVEEVATKHMLELNRQKESPIFRIQSEADWLLSRLNTGVSVPSSFTGYNDISLSNDRHYSNDKHHLAMFALSVRNFRATINQRVHASDIFEIDAFSRAIIASSIWQNTHAISPSNVRINVNPYSLLLHPITTDQGSLYPVGSEDNQSLFFKHDYVFRVLQDEKFYDRFEHNLDALRMASSVLITEHKKICSVFAFDCPEFDIATFQKNFSWMERKGSTFFRELVKSAPGTSRTDGQKLATSKSIPRPPNVEYVNHVNAEYYDDGTLLLWNVLPHNLVLEHIRLVCRSSDECIDRDILVGPINIPASYGSLSPRRVTIEIPEGLTLSRAQFLSIATRSVHERREAVVNLALPARSSNPLLKSNPIAVLSALPSFVMVHNRDVVIRSGEWTVVEPIIIPSGYRLVFEPGATLKFARNTFILSHGSIVARGTTQKPISFNSLHTAQPWRGIYVIDAPAESFLDHVEISGTDAFESGALRLTGAVTFYNSAISVSNTTFANNEAEDMLNIVHSAFSILKTRFVNARSDGLDIDFSNGHISESSFQNIGGDGFDTSGSEVTGDYLEFKNIGDKAISVGEESRVLLSNANVRDAHIGAAVKDGSYLEIQDFHSDRSSRYSAMAFNKKDFYGAARLRLINPILPEDSVVNQEGNQVLIDGHSLSEKSLDVDQLYERQ